MDEPVLGQGFDGFAVELVQRALGLGYEPQRLRSALAERAFEARLLAQRLVTPTSRGAHGLERADSRKRGMRARQTVAPRSINACPAAGEKRWPVRSWMRLTFVSTGRTSRPSAKFATAAAVYGPTPGSSVQVIRPAVGCDRLRGAMEIQAAAVVAEPLPLPDDVRRRMQRRAPSTVGHRSSQAR